ncbi:MAG: PadR family transcriptional regulator [Scytolyngbya sp. HA4215-MV1]|nr:PadR family transcriptional regulator [Scytolyngbya sp. HA4215-MV1]
MTLTYAILALLVDFPQSGYDLTKSFAGSIGFFWKATHQQIYRELARLEDKQWIHAEAIAQDGRPDKKLYRLSETGRAALMKWIVEPCEMAPVKDELLIKVFVGELVSCTKLLQELERHRQLHQKKLATYLDLEQRFFPQPELLPLARKYRYVTLRQGIRYEQEWLAWCDETIQFLSAEVAVSVEA